MRSTSQKPIGNPRGQLPGLLLYIYIIFLLYIYIYSGDTPHPGRPQPPLGPPHPYPGVWGMKWKKFKIFVNILKKEKFIFLFFFIFSFPLTGSENFWFLGVYLAFPGRNNAFSWVSGRLIFLEFSSIFETEWVKILGHETESSPMKKKCQCPKKFQKVNFSTQTKNKEYTILKPRNSTQKQGISSFAKNFCWIFRRVFWNIFTYRVTWGSA